MSVAGKTIVITGASSGIGASLAGLLASHGAHLVLAARRVDRLTSLAETLSAESAGTITPVECDVTNERSAEALIAKTLREFSSIDVLINNAGRGHCGLVEDTTDEVINNIFAVNVFALWHTTRPALREMKRQNRGHIINVASMAGKVGYPLNSAYVAAKHACVGFTKALRLELLDTAIQASVICPAGVFTDWAASTEGASMLPLFEKAKPLIDNISRERGFSHPIVDGPVAPETVARAILDCIDNPVPEVFIQSGSYDLALLSTKDPTEAERLQAPAALGELRTYAKMKHG